MSLYADYLRERTYDEIIETAEGFATYRYVEDGRSVYIIDIYVRPEGRARGLASQLANQIAETAKKRGCTSMLGTVQPSAKGSAVSLQVLLAYGMTLHAASNDAIILRKDI